MNRKNNSNKDIKRRLAVCFAAAVFVFGTCFYPVTNISATEDDSLEAIEYVEDQDTVAGENVEEPAGGQNIENEEVTTEAVESENLPAEESAAEEEVVEAGGLGYHSISEISEKLSVEEGQEPGYMKKKAKRLKAANQPKYLPWEKAYYSGHVQVMDQGDTDTCWAYSASVAAQISYLKELYDTTGIDGDYKLSADDFAYFFYHRQSYPYGYTAKDKNKPKKTYQTNGGNNYLSTTAMSNWMGMHDIGSQSHLSSNAYKNSIVLQNAMFLNDYEVIEGGYKYYVLDEELTKDAIKQYGALNAQIYINEGRYMAKSKQDNYMSSYCNYEGLAGKYKGDSNHAVVIVGWDDTFSKDNFKSTNKPSSDGAWIVQNSWGSDIEGDGYIYVSYEDLSLSGAMAYDMQPADEYDANYQYDGNSMPGWYKDKMKCQVANVYAVPDDGKRHTVEAVGFAAWNEFRTEYRIKVYRGVSTTPTTGKCVANFDVTTDYAGNYTFDFDDYDVEPIDLYTGEKFAVVIQPLTTEESDGRFYIGAESAKKLSWISYESVGKSKKCYYRSSTSSKWKDLYASNKSASFRIKAFTTTVDRISMDETEITLPADNYNYTGKTINPLPAVEYNGETLIKGEDYTVTYSKNKYPGTAKVKVTGKGLYKGSVTKTFTIAAVQNFHQSAATTKSVTLTWDKSPKMNGYKIYRYSSGKYKLVKTITKNTTVKFTNSKLKTDTEYKFKIRSYKKIGKKTYYGPYSSVLPAGTDAPPAVDETSGSGE